MEHPKPQPLYPALSMARLESLAESGDLEALYNLGLRYLHGNVVAQDGRKALAYWKRAAEQGHAASQNNIGFLYSEGLGVPKNEKLALLWYRKAADAGFAIGMVNVGKHYQKGLAVKQDHNKAREFYEQAMDLGNQEAVELLEALPKEVAPKKTFWVLLILLGIIPWAMLYMNVLAPSVDHFLGVDRLAHVKVGYYVIPVLAPPVLLLWLLFRNEDG